MMEMRTDCKCPAGKYYGQHVHADLSVCTLKCHANSWAPENPEENWLRGGKAPNKLQHRNEAAYYGGGGGDLNWIFIMLSLKLAFTDTERPLSCQWQISEITGSKCSRKPENPNKMWAIIRKGVRTQTEGSVLLLFKKSDDLDFEHLSCGLHLSRRR